METLFNLLVSLLVILFCGFFSLAILNGLAFLVLDKVWAFIKAHHKTVPVVLVGGLLPTLDFGQLSNFYLTFPERLVQDFIGTVILVIVIIIAVLLVGHLGWSNEQYAKGDFGKRILGYRAYIQWKQVGLSGYANLAYIKDSHLWSLAKIKETLQQIENLNVKLPITEHRLTWVEKKNGQIVASSVVDNVAHYEINPVYETKPVQPLKAVKRTQKENRKPISKWSDRT